MSFFHKLQSLMRLLLRREAIESELDDEVRCYFETIVERHMQHGIPEAEARRLAHLQFTPPELVKEQVRDARTGALIAEVLQDLNYAVRLIRKNPTFALVTALTLALGIGANSAIFSIISRFVLQPLPVGDPGTLVALHTTERSQCCNNFSWPLFRDLQDGAKSFSGITSYYELVPASIGGRGEPERIWGQAATTNFFDVAQLPMTVGRGFLKDEDHSSVVVLGNWLWRRRFGSDPNIAGKSVVLSGKPFTVVGVAPPSFRGLDDILDGEFWVPIYALDQLAPGQGNFQSRDDHWIAAAGRLRPGISRNQAAAELEVLAARLARTHPESHKDLGFRFETAGSLPPRDRSVISIFFLVLSGLALLVLAIACANVANMFLAQAAGRQREIATRLALGATRARLLRQMVTESLLLALAGGILAVGISSWGVGALSAFHIPAPVPLDTALHVDWRVLLYTLLVTIASGLAFGLTPTWLIARPALNGGLKGADAIGRPGRIWSLRNLLVVVQISMSLVLLCAAGLFLRSLENASHIDIGMHSRGLLTMSVDPRLNGYSPERITQLLATLQQRLRALPGVVAATYTDSIPLSGGHRADGFQVVGKEASTNPESTELYMVGSHYFETVGTPRLSGRALGQENPVGPKVAVINEVFAQRLFSRQNPLGRFVSSGGRIYQIVGVVKNIKARTIGEAPRAVLYRSLAQDVAGDPSMTGYSLLVQFSGDPGALAGEMRAEIRSLDPTLAIFNVETIQEHLRDALFLPRLTGTVFSLFGALGLTLACIGLYGVVNYWVTQRTREIGIRVALGARTGRVQRLVLGQGMLLVLIAIPPGMLLAAGLSKFLVSMLYGVAPYDIATFVFAPIFLFAVAVLACWIPARQAALIEPLTALRHE